MERSQNIFAGALLSIWISGCSDFNVQPNDPNSNFYEVGVSEVSEGANVGKDVGVLKKGLRSVCDEFLVERLITTEQYEYLTSGQIGEIFKDEKSETSLLESSEELEKREKILTNLFSCNNDEVSSLHINASLLSSDPYNAHAFRSIIVDLANNHPETLNDLYNVERVLELAEPYIEQIPFVIENIMKGNTAIISVEELQNEARSQIEEHYEHIVPLVANADMADFLNVEQTVFGSKLPAKVLHDTIKSIIMASVLDYVMKKVKNPSPPALEV